MTTIMTIIRADSKGLEGKLHRGPVYRFQITPIQITPALA